MNKTRRKDIARAIQLVEVIANQLAEHTELSVFSEDLLDAESEVRDIFEAEQDAFESLPEGIQQSERGEASEQASEYLEEAANALETAVCACSENQWNVADESLAEAISNLKLAMK